jgi:hypothetical protein
MDLMSTTSRSSVATKARKARYKRWLRSHGCKELLQELDADRLPPATALRLAHLPPDQQRCALAKRKSHVEAQKIAAHTITQFLGRQPLDLESLCDAITQAVSES